MTTKSEFGQLVLHLQFEDLIQRERHLFFSCFCLLFLKKLLRCVSVLYMKIIGIIPFIFRNSTARRLTIGQIDGLTLHP